MKPHDIPAAGKFNFHALPCFRQFFLHIGVRIGLYAVRPILRAGFKHSTRQKPHKDKDHHRHDQNHHTCHAAASFLLPSVHLLLWPWLSERPLGCCLPLLFRGTLLHRPPGFFSPGFLVCFPVDMGQGKIVAIALVDPVIFLRLIIIQPAFCTNIMAVQLSAAQGTSSAKHRIPSSSGILVLSYYNPRGRATSFPRPDASVRTSPGTAPPSRRGFLPRPAHPSW